jgi:hypothetical protein
MTDAYSLTQKPEIDRIYTVHEIAELFECSDDVVRNISFRLDIPHTYTTKNKARVTIYPYGSLRFFKNYFDARAKKRNETALKKVTLIREEETDGAENHPLVKDKRFLKLSFFPDVIPECFKECEECTH